MNRLLPVVVLFFIAGTIFAYNSNYYLLFLISFFLLFIVIFNKKKLFLFVIIILITFFLGIIHTINYQERGNELYKFVNSSQRIIAEVNNKEAYDFGEIYELKNIKINKKKYSGKISAIIHEKLPDLNYGDIISFKGKLELPEVSRNPGQFNLNKYLKLQSIVLCTEINKTNLNVIDNKGNIVLKKIYNLREKFYKLIDKNLQKREAGIFKAIVLGNKNDIDETNENLFMNYGIMHLLAVSGLHTGFFIMLLIFICNLFKLNSKYEFIICIIGLFFYLVITDFAPPVVRASIMAAVFLLSRLINQEYKIEESIALAVLIILILNPLQLFTASFQLTITAVLGIVYINPLIEYYFKKIKVNKLLIKMFTIPVSAFIAVIPLTAFYFNKISLIGPVISVVVTPFAGIVVISGLTAIIISLFLPVISQFLIVFSGGIIYIILELLRYLNNFFVGSKCVASPNYLILIIFYLSLIFLFLIFRNRENPKLLLFYIKNKKLIIYFGLFFIISIIFLCSFKIDNKLKVTFLDVGQGDAIHIKTPSKKHILVDGGKCSKYTDMGKKVILPYMHYYGLEKIDVVINTHPDNDHIGGLYSVIKEMHPKLVVLPDLDIKSEYEEFLNLLKKENIKYAFVSKGEKLKIDEDIIIEIIHPLANSKLDLNNSSIIFKLSYDNIDLLFTGDVEKNGQELMINNKFLDCEILKVAHHGSNDAFHEKFLNKVSPQIAVISVGKENRFGHPGEKISQWSYKNKVKLYRTDRDGAVTIISDGEKVNVSTMVNSK